MVPRAAAKPMENTNSELGSHGTAVVRPTRFRVGFPSSAGPTSAGLIGTGWGFRSRAEFGAAPAGGVQDRQGRLRPLGGATTHGRTLGRRADPIQSAIFAHWELTSFQPPAVLA